MILHTVFVVSAAAVSKSKSHRLKDFVELETCGVVRARAIILARDKHHLNMQIGSFLCALLAGATAAQFLNTIALDGKAPSPGLFLFIEILLVTIITFCGLYISQISKAFSLREPEQMLCRVGYIVLFFSKVVSPFSTVLFQMVSYTLRVFGMNESVEEKSQVSVQDISEMVDMGTKAGVVEDEAREMIHGIIDFSDTVVREVMTPRTDIIAIAEDASLAEITAIFQKEGVSRVLVRGEDLDQVKGVILMKDLIPFVGSAPLQFDLRKIVRRAYFIPNTKGVSALLSDFRKAAVHFAVVLDERGNVDGVVTLEDLIEEIVGDIFDEHDRPTEEVQVRKTKSGDLLVNGDISIDDFNERTHLKLPHGEYDTLGGFMSHILGRIPKFGDAFDYEGTRLRVESVNMNRVTMVRVFGPKKGGIINRLGTNSFETNPRISDSNNEDAEKGLKDLASGES